jgi:hypothetical protein
MKPTKFFHKKDYDKTDQDFKPVMIMYLIAVLVFIVLIFSLISKSNQ